MNANDDFRTLRSLAAELLGRSVYLIDTADCDIDLTVGPEGGIVLGRTGRRLDLCVRPTLVRKGQWAGRRPCVAINSRGIWEVALASAQGPAAYLAQTISADMRRALLVHEAAHVAELGLDEAPATLELEHRAQLSVGLATTAYIRDVTVCPPWHQHGPHFLRVLAHAIHRAQTAGHTVIESHAYFAPPGAPTIESSLCALESELPALAHVSLFDLRSHPTTSEYRELWKCKTDRWLEQHPDAGGDCAEAMAYFREGVES